MNIDISDLPGTWFRVGHNYQGQILAELPDAFYSVQFYHEPRHVPYQKATVGANVMLGWEFYSSEEAYVGLPSKTGHLS